VPAGKFEGVPSFTATDAGGKLLDVRFEVSDLLWPWSGYLALYLRVRAGGAKFEGTASGQVCMHRCEAWHLGNCVLCLIVS
jgi:membrane-bound transcription factor site-1 protease